MSENNTLGDIRFYELEEFKRSVNRKLWFMVGGLFLVTILSLLGMMLQITRPLPVVMIDAQGKPVLFEDSVSPQLEMSNIRVEYFMEEFLSDFILVDSSNVSDGLTQALNGMTPRLREVVVADGKEAQRRANYQDKNVRSRFEKIEMQVAEYEPQEREGRIHAIAHGSIVYEPRVGVGENLRQFFYSQLVLDRVPVRKNSIHGLLADFVNTKMFDNEEDMRLYVLKREP